MPQTPTSARRAARETALRTLYMLEVGKPEREEALSETITANDLEGEAATFARTLVEGILERQARVDVKIQQHAIGYPLERQAAVDRNILRLAVGEIVLGLSDAPYGVIANEAVELAKKYSTPAGAKFVNGVLGAVIREKEARDAA